MIDPRIFNVLLNLEARCNEMSAELRMTGRSARREGIKRMEISHELEIMADKLAKLSEILERKYGRDEPVG